MEKVAGKLGRAIVASKDFAIHCSGALEPIGEFEVAGFSVPQTVFGVRDSGASQQ
jgi:hypothetical protein